MNINIDNFDNIMDEITNREDLRDYIHEIHNYLRNSGAAFGMNALKMFNFFYGLSLIDKDEKVFQESGLSDICRFKELVKIKNPNARLVRVGEILTELYQCGASDNEKLRRMEKLLFYDIPQEIHCSIYNELINRVKNIQDSESNDNKITMKKKFQLSGKTYEYFIGRDKAAIQDMGAYFTDRHIVNYIFEEKLKPQLNEDNSIKSMIDPFGGSGGFTIGYINYLNENFKNEIDWKTEIDKISHVDMNRDVVKVASIEAFGLTGAIPNLDSNFMTKNSFKYDFIDLNNLNNEYLKYDLVITNPPYGGDKMKKNHSIIKCEKIIKFKELKIAENKKKIAKCTNDKLKKILNYVNNQYFEEINKLEKKIESINDCNDDKKVQFSECSGRIQNYAIHNELAFEKKKNIKNNEGQNIPTTIYESSLNDKEACSVVLMMDLLKQNGTCVAVIKEGFFFDSKYSEIRKRLVENFNVSDIISVPEKQFENTPTKTSIIIFHNTNEKTSVINFYDLEVEKEEKDVFKTSILIGDSEFDLEDDEDEEKLMNQFDFENNKNLPIFKTTILKLKDDIKDDGVKEKLIVSVPVNSIHKNNYSFNSKEYNKMNIIFNENYELINFGNFFDSQKGYAFEKNDFKEKGEYKIIKNSDIKSNILLDINNYCYIDKSDKLTKFEVFKNDLLIGLVGDVGKIGIYLDNNKSYLNQNTAIFRPKNINYTFLFTLYKIFDIENNIKKEANGTNQKSISVLDIQKQKIALPINEERRNYWVNTSKNYLESYINSFKELRSLEEQIMNKINEVIESGKYQMKTIKELCEINYGTRIVKKNTEPGEYYVYGGGDKTFTTNKYNRDGFNVLIGRFAISEECIRLKYEKLFLNDSGMTIESKNKNINLLKYIGYYLFNNQNLVMNCTNGSIQKNVNIDMFKNLNIQIPSNEILEEFSDLFKNVEKYYLLTQQREKEYEELIQQFRNESIKEIVFGNFENEEQNTENIEQKSISSKTSSSKSSKTSAKALKKDDNIPYCKAILKNKCNCTNKGKFDGYCGNHKSQAKKEIENVHPDILAIQNSIVSTTDNSIIKKEEVKKRVLKKKN